MEIQSVIDKFDIQYYQEIIGKEAYSIVNKINKIEINISKSKEILNNLYNSSALLRYKISRDVIIDCLNTEEIIELQTLLRMKTIIPLYEEVKKELNNKKAIKSLFKFFEIDYTPITPNKVEYLVEGKCAYPLFKHQRQAVANVLKAFVNNDRILLHMPTGSGKTRTAIHSICYHLILNEPTVVVWLADSEELCSQTVVEMEKAWVNLGNREISIVKYWGDAKNDLGEIKDGIIICGLQKLNQQVIANNSMVSSLASKCSYLIMDEAHKSIAPTYATLIDVFMQINVGIGHKIKFLGLSATPGRTWNNPTEDERLAKFFNRKKVNLVVEGYNNPIDYLVQEGYIASIINTPLTHSDSLSDRDRQEIANQLDIPANILLKLSEDSLRNLLIVSSIKLLIQRHKRIILFAISVKHSNIIASALQALNITAMSVTSDTDPQLRRDYIEEYKSEKETSIVLCNYGILTTGFDAPKTSCAVITRPTKSLVLYSQMVGRAIRGIRAGGNREAEILTVLDTSLPGYESLSSTFFNWEDVW